MYSLPRNLPSHLLNAKTIENTELEAELQNRAIDFSTTGHSGSMTQRTE